ncbi:MAG: hypothetical protein V4635_02130 [Bacteroidota bacterium]
MKNRIGVNKLIISATAPNTCSFQRRFINSLLAACFFLNSACSLRAQDFNLNSAIYNVVIGAVSGGLGGMINKNKDQKSYQAFLRGFATGGGGGAVMYCGKKLNFLVSQKQRLGYAWVSRAVFSAGNSIVENAAANRQFWSQWHYDVAFLRLEFNVKPLTFTPRLMPSNFGGILFMAIHGRLDGEATLKSGTLTFRTRRIEYYPTLIGSTAGNGFLLNDTIGGGTFFYDVYAHEMIHTFQFQELSGLNYLFTPVTSKWKQQSIFLRKYGKWIYGDLNYELMLINYFIINGGLQHGRYCANLLENEAEFLSTGRRACH